MATKKDLTLLGTIVASMANADAPFHFVTEKDVAALVKEGYVETNKEIADGDKIAARATDAGIAALTPPASGTPSWPTGGTPAVDTPPAGDSSAETPQGEASGEVQGDDAAAALKRTTG